MFEKLTRHVTVANAVAFGALFVALGTTALGGTGSGDAKASKSTVWAVVSDNGKLVRGSGVVSTHHLFTNFGVQGSYEVDFNRKVSHCALSATLGRTNAADKDPDPGEIGVAYRNGKPKAMYVKTLDSSGIGADQGFHAIVVC
jgi:hypothetical protein